MVMLINRDELRKKVCCGRSLKIVDVLDREHFEKEHIRGAISMPLDEIETKAGMLLSKEDEVVVYCASFECPASTMAAEKLIAMGFRNVSDYKGGIKDYREMGWPLEGSLHRVGAPALECAAVAC